MLNFTNKYFYVSDDLDRLFQTAAQKWIELAQQCIKKRKLFVVALSGGESPIPFFKALSKFVPNELWQKTHIFLVDERCASGKNDKETNIFTIDKYLISKITVPQRNIHAIAPTRKSSIKNARNYEKHIKNFFKLRYQQIPKFDLMVLGLGQDGHVASLFPDTDMSGIQNQIIAVTSSGKAKYERITLTLPAINHSRHIFFIIYGKTKSNIFKKVFHDRLLYPASFVECPGGQICYFLDQDAISKMPLATFVSSGHRTNSF